MPNPLTLPVFAFPPNWDPPPMLRLRALTDLWSGATGREERNARLRTPALATRFTVDTGIEHELSQQIARFFRENIGSQIVAPLWSEQVYLDGAIAGQTIPVTSTAGRFFHVDRATIIWESATQYQVFTVASFTASEIVSNEAIAASYSTDAVVAPCIVTEPVTDEQSVEWLTTFFASGQVEFDEAVDTALALQSPSTLAAFRGLPIWPFLLNEEDAPVTEFGRETESYRGDGGLVSVAVLEAAARTRLSGRVALADRPQVARAFAFFGSRLGRWGRCWVPSGRFDHVLDALHDGTNLLVVRSHGFAAEFAANRWALLVRSGGLWHAREITAALDLGNGYERLTLETELPILPTSARVSALMLARSETDDMEFEFQTNDLADVGLEFLELPEEYSTALAGSGPANGTLDATEALLP